MPIYSSQRRKMFSLFWSDVVASKWIYVLFKLVWEYQLLRIFFWKISVLELISDPL